MPYRCWCKACVEGRLENHPHPHSSKRDHEVPTVLMDYGFVSKSEDEKKLALLVMKDRDSKTIMVDVAMHKSRGEEELVEHSQGEG